jgi:hypothetical protein
MSGREGQTRSEIVLRGLKYRSLRSVDITNKLNYLERPGPRPEVETTHQTHMIYMEVAPWYIHMKLCATEFSSRCLNFSDWMGTCGSVPVEFSGVTVTVTPGWL